jgi:amino acid transporter
MGAKKKEKLLKRDLGLLGIFCIASGAMISSGLFVLPGIAYSKAGPAIILAYGIASLLVLPAILAKAELSTAMPKAGGTYFFIDRAMGPLMGTIGGFAAWFSLAFKSAFALVGIGIFAYLINPIFNDELYTKIIAVIFCIIFAIINMRGVKHSEKTQIFLVLGLLLLLIVYIIVGLFFINTSNFDNFVPYGEWSIFSTAGLILVSYGGLTKVCSVAEECKNPGRNIPLGMFLSWGIISIIYILVIYVTVGLVDPNVLSGSVRPITDGANAIPILAGFGGGLMAIAAILAFISTANAGILAASRNPMAMGKDQLLPKDFAYVSKRGTPTFSIISTSGFMIFVILFLDLENLVKTASTLKILLFVFVIISVIIMRQSKIRNYRPKFKTPFYPYVLIAGLIGFIFVLSQMGIVPMVLVGCFILFGLFWYAIFARDKIWREYTFLHLIEQITQTKSTGYLVDEELREILIERDDLEEIRFETLIKNSEIVDLYKLMRHDKLALLISEKLSKKLKIDKDKLFMLLTHSKRDSSCMIHPGIAIFSHTIKGRNKFEMLMIRSKMGIKLSDDLDSINTFFIVVSSNDQKQFYLHTLMWIIQITEDEDFEKEWINAKNEDELKKIILKYWAKRESF